METVEWALFLRTGRFEHEEKEKEEIKSQRDLRDRGNNWLNNVMENV